MVHPAQILSYKKMDPGATQRTKRVETELLHEVFFVISIRWCNIYYLFKLFTLLEIVSQTVDLIINIVIGLLFP